MTVAGLAGGTSLATWWSHAALGRVESRRLNPVIRRRSHKSSRRDRLQPHLLGDVLDHPNQEPRPLAGRLIWRTPFRHLGVEITGFDAAAQLGPAGARGANLCSSR